MRYKSRCHVDLPGSVLKGRDHGLLPLLLPFHLLLAWILKLSFGLGGENQSHSKAKQEGKAWDADDYRTAILILDGLEGNELIFC